MITKSKTKNLFLKRIAKEIELSVNSEDFFEQCEVMIGNGGASNCFVYCSENREFLKKNRELIKEELIQFFNDMGISAFNYDYTCFGQPLDDSFKEEILGFLFGGRIPPQGTGCDWLVWASVENHLFNREEEITKKKWN